MTYQRGEHLYHYDIFPKVVVAGKETVIHIRPLGVRPAFIPGHRYIADIRGMATGSPDHYPASAEVAKVEVVCNEDGSLDIPHTFPCEQDYSIRMHDPENKERTKMHRFYVYCVAPDLAGLYPWMGDCHIHSYMSDGYEAPEVTCANYRAHGYDFMPVTDHERYAPSLRAMAFFKDVPMGLTILPGEEVHLRTLKHGEMEPHIVNFGGTWSVNALGNTHGRITMYDGPVESRSTVADCPDIMTPEQFSDLMEDLSQAIDVPEKVEPFQAAIVKWTCDRIRESGGLAIYAHPNWITGDVFNVPDAMHNYLVENRIFDAFEVLGGDKHCYLEQQGYQTVRYYKDQARGYRYPVVGNTDSHSCYPTNPIAYAAATIVLSAANERTALIQAIKDFHSVAIDNLDTTGDHFRLVGEERMVRYGTFLLRNYFPIHDEYCQQEGRLMRQYAVGAPDEKAEALALLKAMNHYVERHCRKYFDF